SSGFYITLFLLLLSVIPTIVSFYHFVLGVRIYYSLSAEVWSNTARSLVGWKSVLSPLRLIHLRRNSPISIGFGPSWGSVFSRDSIGDYIYPGIFGRWFVEFERVERKHMPLLPNNEPVALYLIRFVNTLAKKKLMSQREQDLWVRALRHEKGGRFIDPKSKKGHNVLYDVFFALSQSKPRTPAFSSLEPTSGLVNACGELFSHIFAEFGLPGTFNDHPRDPNKKSNLLGYMARNHKPEWRNVISRLRTLLPNSAASVLDDLSKINEWSPVYQILYSNNGLTNEQQTTIVAEIAQWLDEMRPSNLGVIESQGADIVEMHLALSSQLGDLDYFDAVQEAVSSHDSLAAAVREQNGRGVETALTEKYTRYQEIVATKMSHIFMDAAWPSQTFLHQGHIKFFTGSFLKKYSPSIESQDAQNDKKDEAGRILDKVRDHGYDSLTGDEVKFWEDWVHGFKITENSSPEGCRHWAVYLGADSVRRYREISPGGITDNESLTAWAREYKHWIDAHGDTVAYLFANELSPSSSPHFMKTIKLASTAVACADNEVLLPLYREPGVVAQNNDYISGMAKNNYSCMNLHLMFDASTLYDAHSRISPGQNVWRPAWATLYGSNPELQIVNPMMRIWATSTWAFPGTKIYSISQENWTSEVQRGRRNMLTFYGKGSGRQRGAIIALMPPGEDSASFLMGQAKYGASRSTQIDWFVFEWGRPSLFGESIASTEIRYAFNCTRFMMDRGQYELFFNPAIGVDKKLSHLMLWFHYFIAPFAVLLIIFLPAYAPFSAYAFLRPALIFLTVSTLLMIMINKNNLHRHWRQTASFWLAFVLLIRDTLVALPYYVFLIPQFFKGLWLASNERFSFIPTEKDAILQKWSPQEKFDKAMRFNLYNKDKPYPFNGVVGILGLVSFAIAISYMTPMGPAAIVLNFLASLVFLTGIFVYAAFTNIKGNLKGIAFSKIITMLAFVIGNTLKSLTFKGKIGFSAMITLLFLPQFPFLAVLFAGSKILAVILTPIILMGMILTVLNIPEIITFLKNSRPYGHLTDQNNYPMAVPADHHNDDFTRSVSVRAILNDKKYDLETVEGELPLVFEEAIASRLQSILPLTTRGPPILTIVITEDMALTNNMVARVAIADSTIYLHTYFFSLNEEGLSDLGLETKQIEILYHEAISHIGHNETDEERAIADTAAIRSEIRYQYYRSFVDSSNRTKFDVTPLFAEAEVLSRLNGDFAQLVSDIDFDKIAGLEATGFILGASLAQATGSGFVAIRKGGKLTAKDDSIVMTSFVDYSETTKTFELNRTLVKPGDRIILVDDYIHSGSQLFAAINLLEELGAEVVGVLAISSNYHVKTAVLFEKYNLRVIRVKRTNTSGADRVIVDKINSATADKLNYHSFSNKFSFAVLLMVGGILLLIGIFSRLNSSSKSERTLRLKHSDLRKNGIGVLFNGTQAIIESRGDWPFVLKLFMDEAADYVFSEEAVTSYTIAKERLGGIVVDFIFIEIQGNYGQYETAVIMRKVTLDDMTTQLREHVEFGEIDKAKQLIRGQVAAVENILLRGAMPLDAAFANFGLVGGQIRMLDPGHLDVEYSASSISKFLQMVTQNSNYLTINLGSQELGDYYSEQLAKRGLDNDNIGNTLGRVFNTKKAVAVESFVEEVASSLGAELVVDSENDDFVDANFNHLNGFERITVPDDFRSRSREGTVIAEQSNGNWDLRPVGGFLNEFDEAILSHRLQVLGYLSNRAPPQVTIFVTNDSSKTNGYVAAADISRRIVYLHSYFFSLSQENLDSIGLGFKQVEILYHEIISHISFGFGDEEQAFNHSDLNVNNNELSLAGYIIHSNLIERRQLESEELSRLLARSLFETYAEFSISGDLDRKRDPLLLDRRYIADFSLERITKQHKIDLDADLVAATDAVVDTTHNKLAIIRHAQAHEAIEKARILSKECNFSNQQEVGEVVKIYQRGLDLLRRAMTGTSFRYRYIKEFEAISKEWHEFMVESGYATNLPRMHIVIISSNRPHVLSANLRSIVDYLNKIGYAGLSYDHYLGKEVFDRVHVAVVDDSDDEGKQEQTERDCEDFVLNNPLDVRYYGPAQINGLLSAIDSENSLDLHFFNKDSETLKYDINMPDGYKRARRSFDGNRNVAQLVALAMRSEHPDEPDQVIRYLDDDARLQSAHRDRGDRNQWDYLFDDFMEVIRAKTENANMVVLGNPVTMDGAVRPIQSFRGVIRDVLEFFEYMANVKPRDTYAPSRNVYKLAYGEHNYDNFTGKGLGFTPMLRHEDRGISNRNQLMSYFQRILDSIIGRHPSRPLLFHSPSLTGEVRKSTEGIVQVLKPTTESANFSGGANCSHFGNLGVMYVQDGPQGLREDLNFHILVNAFYNGGVLRGSYPVIHYRTIENFEDVEMGVRKAIDTLYSYMGSCVFTYTLKDLIAEYHIRSPEKYVEIITERPDEVRKLIAEKYDYYFNKYWDRTIKALQQMQDYLHMIDEAGFLTDEAFWWNVSGEHEVIEAMSKVRRLIRVFKERFQPDSSEIREIYHKYMVSSKEDLLSNITFRLMRIGEDVFSWRELLRRRKAVFAIHQRIADLVLSLTRVDPEIDSDIKRYNLSEETNEVLMSVISTASLQNLNNNQKMAIVLRKLSRIYSKQEAKVIFDILYMLLSKESSFLYRKAIVRVYPMEFIGTVGGIERHLGMLNRGLADRHSMTIVQMYITKDQRRQVEVEEVGSGRIVYWPVKWSMRYGERDFEATAKRFHQALRYIKTEYAPEFAMFHEPLTTISPALARIIKSEEIKLAIQFHRGKLLDTPDWISAAEHLREVVNIADFAAGISKSGLEQIGRQDADNLGNGIEISTFRRSIPYSEKVENDKVYILSPNRITVEKGADILIEAVIRLAEKGINDIRVRLQGDSDPVLIAFLRERIESAGIGEYVEFMPAVSTEDLVKEYHKADIVVLPSRSEGLGRILLEAQVAEIPVVGSKQGGIPEAMIDGKTGFLFENLNADDLADKLAELIQSKELRIRLGLAGRDFVQENFSSEALLAKHEAFYEKIIFATQDNIEVEAENSSSLILLSVLSLLAIVLITLSQEVTLLYYPMRVPNGWSSGKPQKRITAVLSDQGYRLSVPEESQYHSEVETLTRHFNELTYITSRAPPRVDIIITDDLGVTDGFVAAADIANATVYLNTYFFSLVQEGLSQNAIETKQIEILYHEAISHIAYRESNEERALADTVSVMDAIHSDRDRFYALGSQTPSVVEMLALELEKYSTSAENDVFEQEKKHYIFVVSNPSVTGGGETYVFTEVFYLLQRNDIVIHIAFVSNNDDLARMQSRQYQINNRGMVYFHGADSLDSFKSVVEGIADTNAIEGIVCLVPSEKETTLALDVAQEKGLKSVVYYHGSDDPIRRRAVLDNPGNATRINLQRANRTAVVSLAGMRALRSIGIQKSYLAGPLCRMENFRPSKDKDQAAGELIKNYGLSEKFVVFSPNRIIRDKGPEEAIRALAILKDQGIEDVVLIFAGAATKNFGREINHLINTSGLAGKVIILGQLSQQEVSIWSRASDLIICPSYSEGFGLTVLEAAVSQRMALATQAGGIPEAMLDGLTGLIINFELDKNDANRNRVIVHNSEVLAQGLLTAYKLSVDERLAMGQRGGRYAQRFAPEALIERHEVVIGIASKHNRASYFAGDIKFEGNYSIENSYISVGEGITLVIEDGVEVKDTLIKIAGIAQGSVFVLGEGARIYQSRLLIDSRNEESMNGVKDLFIHNNYSINESKDLSPDFNDDSKVSALARENIISDIRRLISIKTLDPIFDISADSREKLSEAKLIWIAGGTNTGTSTIASFIGNSISKGERIQVLHLDRFYLDDSQRPRDGTGVFSDLNRPESIIWSELRVALEEALRSNDVVIVEGLYFATGRIELPKETKSLLVYVEGPGLNSVSASSVQFARDLARGRNGSSQTKHHVWDAIVRVHDELIEQQKDQAQILLKTLVTQSEYFWLLDHLHIGKLLSNTDAEKSMIDGILREMNNVDSGTLDSYQGIVVKEEQSGPDDSHAVSALFMIAFSVFLFYSGARQAAKRIETAYANIRSGRQHWDQV
ncbi:MAG: glycosyltransferase, partial [Candidatus Omnitrophica bacterium]|nr:glycosyltransferase [Candidatus Omnitrophota bacterium]